jgi:hypothetical protein
MDGGRMPEISQFADALLMIHLLVCVGQHTSVYGESSERVPFFPSREPH